MAKTATRQPGGAKKRPTKQRGTRKAKRGVRHRATSSDLGRLATWEGLFGDAEALRRGEAHFEGADAVARGIESVARILPPGQIEALFGIWWINPTFPIFYRLVVNDTPLPPQSTRGGQAIQSIVLRVGRNTVGWSVKHTGQGWRQRVFLKLAGGVIELDPAADPSGATSDDLAMGFRTIDVPA